MKGQNKPANKRREHQRGGGSRTKGPQQYPSRPRTVEKRFWRN